MTTSYPKVCVGRPQTRVEPYECPVCQRRWDQFEEYDKMEGEWRFAAEPYGFCRHCAPDDEPPSGVEQVSYPTPKVCVGVKRGRNYGLVYAPNGDVIGRVFKQSKDARKCDGGGKQMFYTANVALDGVEAGGSLGTRHRTRRSAVAAILAFHASYPAAAIYEAAGRANALDFETWGGAAPLTMQERADRAMRRALGSAAAQFKYDNWQVCALSQRNLTDPRLSRWHTPIQPHV